MVANAGKGEKKAAAMDGQNSLALHAYQT